jgi:A/G-specific adenine glycosylase
VAAHASRTDGAAALTRVRRALQRWYAAKHRDFPWRGTRDPWALLVSEVMLQQTQASRIAQRFPPFLARFPSPASLVAASAAELLTAWSGLGYNRRALALRRAATVIVAEGWPRDLAGLEGLPGVGPYTARAVASLAFGDPVGVVDTNVRRWLVRRFGLPPGTRPATLQALADRLARPAEAAQVAAWTHATMEFGARICTSRTPHCDACPIARGCPSRGRAAAVPVPPQPAFRGSRRAARGTLLRRLVAAGERSISIEGARRAVPGVSRADFDRIVGDLQHDGLLHRARGRLHLGGPATAAGAATIGP